ncbi:type VI secretion system Vgr family protein [Schlesneria paludicola]|uniref:type VI secretion system Vgr family protein n=1 Tax=Schlesneria paludicola TaxID=360056 RepID=UPI00029B24A8|nr:type VI secretion system tip protein VgrG [Schlesneria paludicola]
MAINRVSFTIPGGDDLTLRRVTTIEQLGRPFEYHVELLSQSNTLTYEDFLGQSATISYELPRGGTRYFNGIVASFGQTSIDGGTHVFRAILRPWFWLMSRTSDCRIFQNLSVPDIFEQVCSDLGFVDRKNSLTGTYVARKFCCQYRESAFQFLSRLFEEEGIYYFFKHESGKHTLTLCDGASAHESFANYEDLPFAPMKLHEERVDSWNPALELQPVKHVLRDFDFQNPTADLSAILNTSRSHQHANLEVYDYPGRYYTTDIGNNFVTVRNDEAQAQFLRINATCDTCAINPGYLLKLTDHPRDDQNTDYLIVSAKHDFVNPDVVPGVEHHSDFVVIPKTQTFRSQRTTPKPVISGLQTAIVTGKSGEEIWTDEYGRVKVQFHWDRVGQSDENSSCWIRVAQSWAGKKWGSQFLPRIGQEVVVEFVEGDPDRPLITGSVYNANQPVPYELPANATQSGVKTRSSKTGDEQTFNELRFEDKKESELVYFHAQKDFQRVVENNDSLTVGLETKDPGDQTIQIHNHRTVTLDEGNDTLLVKKGKREGTISEGDDLLTVSKGKQEVTISEGNQILTVSQGNQTITVSQGDQSVTITAGSSTTEAGTAIELKVGGNSIKIDSSGITIKGTKISIEGVAKTDIKAPKVSVTADGDLTLMGSMTKIN